MGKEVVAEFYAADRAAWRRWLQDNHATKTSVWLVFDKGKDRRLSYDDIVEEALCFGWIDSVPGKVDNTRSKLYVSKRNPRSVWSKLNKGRITKLEKEGRIEPAGLLAIEAAKANGSWDTLKQSDELIVPPDLEALFQANAAAKRHYEAFSPSSKRIILEWIYAAKRAETRQRRIEETVRLAADNLKANHYRQ